MYMLKVVSLGEKISDYLCPNCKHNGLYLGGFHIDGSMPDLIVSCGRCGWEGETDNNGKNLIPITEQ